MGSSVWACLLEEMLHKIRIRRPTWRRTQRPSPPQRPHFAGSSSVRASCTVISEPSSSKVDKFSAMSLAIAASSNKTQATGGRPSRESLKLAHSTWLGNVSCKKHWKVCSEIKGKLVKCNVLLDPPQVFSCCLRGCTSTGSGLPQAAPAPPPPAFGARYSVRAHSARRVAPSQSKPSNCCRADSAA